MKIGIVVGTRPEIIKMAPVVRACIAQGADYIDSTGERVDTSSPEYDGPEALTVALHGVFNQRRFLELFQRDLEPRLRKLG